MTYQELLHSVDFRKVAEVYCKMYPGQAHMLPFLKCHYDMLCNMTPVYDPEANSQVCRISMKCDEGTEKRYLSAFSMEGDLWSASLCKTLEIAPDVTASLEEIAACCLWHTSFYGYTEEQLADTAEELSNEWRDMSDLEMYKLKLSHNLATIEQRYNYNPNLPSFNDIYKLVKSKANERYKIYKRRQIKKRIRNRWFRRDFIKTEYYRYLYGISQFILDLKTPDESIEGLIQFYMYKKFIVYNYRSYTYGKSDPAKYLQELIDEYKAFDKTYANVYICLVRATENNSTLSKSERELRYSIISSCSGWGPFDIKTKQDSTLDNEMRMIVAFYESVIF